MYTRTCFVVTVLLIIIRCCYSQQLNQNYFPPQFLFGVATASYQVEGGWNANGKGENIWDRFTHTHPEKIHNNSNADIACDSYNKVNEDIQLVKNLAVDFYRFSLSWSRILPTGFINVINDDGVRYYNNLIDGLLANNVTPIVTLYHWDLPQPLQDIGGWPNPLLAELFVDFADTVFKLFGDRVKTWITFNEIVHVCKYGYGEGFLAPGIVSDGIGDYMCMPTVLRAHAQAYHLYTRKYKAIQNGKVGFTIHSYWFEPASNSAADEAAARRLFEFYTGIATNPIYGTGDFPEVVKDFVAARSKRQGFTSSRLPTLSTEDVNLIKGSADFFGLNFYTSLLVANAKEEPLNVVSWDTDSRVKFFHNVSWAPSSSPWLKVTPWAIRRTLKKLKDVYGEMPIYIFENGYSDYGELNDINRCNYLLTYLSSCLDAIYEDKVNLIGYTVWSLIDNFEWHAGYERRFGLHYVNFDDPNRPRVRKYSAEIYGEIIKNRKLPAVLEKGVETR